jgi:hypothetical protein
MAITRTNLDSSQSLALLRLIADMAKPEVEVSSDPQGSLRSGIRDTNAICQACLPSLDITVAADTTLSAATKNILHLARSATTTALLVRPNLVHIEYLFGRRRSGCEVSRGIALNVGFDRGRIPS